MRNRTYGGVRGRKTKVGRKLLRFPPTRFYIFGNILATYFDANLLWLLKAESFLHSFTQF